VEEIIPDRLTGTNRETVEQRAAALFKELRRTIFVHTDRLFAALMMFQWAAAITAALWIAPRTWAGQYSQIHEHVWAALFLGGAVTLFPVALAIYRPGEASTRHVIATSQMLMSALLIHLTGGRLETHFHIFGSLAFLAFYRDWRVFVPATLVVAADHFLRGVYWPMSVFGVLTASPWRWIEHAGWMVFETVFLVYSSLQTERALKITARQQAELEATNELSLQRVRDLEASEIKLSRAKDAAEAGSRAKSTFLATIGHEIRTPLNGILGMADMVLDTELTSNQRDSLGMVRLSAESLMAVLNDVLDFSKIEAGKIALEPRPFHLRDILGETMKTLGFRAHHKGLEIVYDVQSEVPDTVVGDPGRLRQVLVNLVGNAIKFTEQGEILVIVACEPPQGAAQTVFLHFSVRDTGIGIPASKQADIFEPFSQADDSLTRKHGGSGLGLAICSRLVDLMGGTMWVESQVGHGSTVHFTASLGLPSAVSPPLVAIQPEPLNGMTALIVDDNVTNRAVLKAMLTRWGMRPTAVDGERAAMLAVEAARSSGNPFPLILLDSHMPEIDGCALAQEIQNSPASTAATVMMITSADQLRNGGRCGDSSIAAYLTKPIRSSELLEAIRGILTGATLPHPQAWSAPKARGPWKVLLVEDNKVNQTLARRLLEKHGCAVSLAADGRAALAALEQDCFDVVLMDIQMPVMDGFEATGEIRKKELLTGGHLPIIAITANVMEGERARCLSMGMDGYVVKPILPDELFAAIDSALTEPGGTHAEALPL
jgi:two-component system sensor histidine kinase/response regulator